MNRVGIPCIFDQIHPFLLIIVVIIGIRDLKFYLDSAVVLLHFFIGVDIHGIRCLFPAHARRPVRRRKFPFSIFYAGGIGSAFIGKMHLIDCGVFRIILIIRQSRPIGKIDLINIPIEIYDQIRTCGHRNRSEQQNCRQYYCSGVSSHAYTTAPLIIKK